MTKVATDIKNYEDIAAAIREKLNTDVEYLPSEMPDAIRAITRYPKLSDITISHNGTTIPDEGYDGFYEVTVDVPIIQGSITLTSNGVYNAIDDNVLGYRTVIVNTLNDDRVVDRTVDIYHNNEISNVRQYAFARCSNLYDISLPECEIIGNSAFIYCSNLSQVFFEKCKTIQTSAFANCFNLKKIEFPKCETIESYAFNNNYYSYYYAEAVNTYYSQRFSTYYYNYTNYYYSNTYTFETICSSYRKLTEISLPECLTIGQYAFECQGIEELSLPKVQNIGSSAFQNCQHLSKITLDECINLGNNNAFMYCYNLHTINLPKCKFIGNSHFMSCPGLQNIYAPECLSIGYQTFYRCYGLSNISLPKCKIISQYAFEACYSLFSISLPNCSYFSYQAFAYCSNLSTVILPGCKYINNRVFVGCSNLSMLILPTSSIVQLQSSDAFANTPINYSSYLGYYGSIYVPESLYQAYRVADGWDRLQLRLAHYEGTFHLPTDIEATQLPNKLFYKTENDTIDLTGLIIQAYLTTLESKNIYTNDDYPTGIIPNNELETEINYNTFNLDKIPTNIKIIENYEEYLCTINGTKYYYLGHKPILFCTVQLSGWICGFLISNDESTLRYRDTSFGTNRPWQSGTFTYNEVLYYIKITDSYSGNNVDIPIIGSASNIADLCRIYFNLSDEIEKFYTLSPDQATYLKISWPRPFDQVKLKTKCLIDVPKDLILKINQNPTKLNYYENEIIDFTNLEIEAYFKHSDRKLNDNEIINGIIPHNNLIFPKTSATIDKITFDSFSDWTTYLPQNTSITITNNQINIVGVSLSNYHEKLYKEVSVEKNTDYIFKLEFSSLPFEEISPYHAYFLVMKSAPPASGWFENGTEVIEKTQILSNSNGEYSVVFNSGNNTTVYLVIDFAAFLDNVTFDLNFSNIQFYKIKNLLIPVQWENPYNNDILETSFQINILDKPKANEMRIISMPNKINYFDSEEVDYTGLVIQAYDEYGDIWTNEGLYPNGIVPLDNLVLPETIAHINDLSWSADEDWIVENANEYLGTVNERRFTKSNNGKAITCFLQGSNGWYGPTLISTDQNSVNYKVNGSNISPILTTVSYKYYTWYMNTNYYYQNPYAWDAPKNIIKHNQTEQELLIYILDQANIKVEGTSVNTITISWRINSKVLTVPLNINVHARPDIKEIKIESLPRKIIYNDGDIIDYTGLIVKLYDSNDNIYTDSYYPTGEIPLNEIIFSDNKATYSKSRTGIANSLMQGNLQQPIQFHQGPGICKHFSGNIFHDNQPPHVRVFTVVHSNTSLTTWWLSLKPFDIPRIIEQSDGTIITDILGSGKKHNYNGLLYYSYSITINENIGNWIESYPLSYGTTNEYDLLTILYGDIELSYKQKINIQWKHPFDTYKCSTSFDIYVEPQISKIDFIKNPDKKIYTNEDNIDYSGLIVKAYDENGNLWEENNYYNGIIPLEEFTVLNPGATYYYPSYFVNSQALVSNEGIICENNGDRSPITKVNNEESICFIVTDAGGNDYGGNWIFVFSIGFTDSAAKLTSPSIGSTTIQIDGITYYIYWSGSNASWGGATEFYNPLNLPVFNGKVININSSPTVEQLKYMLELVDFSTNTDPTNIVQTIYLLWENPNNGYISVISYPVVVIADKNAFINKDISLPFLTVLHKLH